MLLLSGSQPQLDTIADVISDPLSRDILVQENYGVHDFLLSREALVDHRHRIKVRERDKRGPDCLARDSKLTLSCP